MQAIRIHQNGTADSLVLDQVPVPTPGPGQVRVKLAAAGLNFIDIYQREGLYPIPTPFIPGLEGAGTVDALGEGVTDFAQGDGVAYTMTPNSYAEYVVVPAAHLVPVPQGVSLQTAAAAMLQGLTAHYLSHSTYPLKAGDVCLVTAASGGVGLLLVQMAKMRGARVIGTVSTEEKATLARQAGADEIILYTQVNMQEEALRLNGGQKLDVVYDSIGKDTFEMSLNILKPRGYMVLYGQASGPVPDISPQILNQKGSLFLTRPSLGAYIQTRDELLSRSNQMFGWIQAGQLDVRIDITFPLAQARDAHRYMEARKTRGKVLIIP